METRNVIIINSKTQTQTRFQSSATTLGELKQEAINNGVDIEGLTWFEGHLRAELIDDAAVLPTSVNYRGRETTDLTFMLSVPNKKITSGVDRKELFNKIKALGVTDACYTHYDKNFTRCSNAELQHIIDLYEEDEEETSDSAQEETVVEPESSSNSAPNASTDIASLAVKRMAEILYSNSVINLSEYKEITAIIGSHTVSAEDISTDEINEMFDFVK